MSTSEAAETSAQGSSAAAGKSNMVAAEPSSCGALLHQVRWQEILARRRWLYAAEKDESSRVIQKRVVNGTHFSFAFAALLPELQIEVVEKLGYNDLKCLEFTGLWMQNFLRNTNARQLNATLFRSKVDPLILAAHQATFASLHAEQRDSKGPVVFHHLVFLRSTYRFDLQIPIYLGDTWADARVTLSGRPTPMHVSIFAQVSCPVSSLREGTENATEPPTSKLHVVLWNPDWAAAIVEIGQGSINDIKPVEITLQAEGEGEGNAVTLGQFMKAIFTMLEQVKQHLQAHGVKYMAVVPPKLVGWKTQYLDETGCLHLLDSKWAYGAASS